MIIIHRDNLLDVKRSYKIIIDDTYYGKIKCGETKQINLEKGDHTIYLKIDWCRSPKLNFSTSDNETIFFDCGNYMNGWKQLLFPLYITFLKNKYLFLEETNKKFS